MDKLLELVRSRKSVRSYDGRPLSAEDRAKLEAFVEAPEAPFGVPVRIVLLDAAEHGLSSPVLTGEKLYAAGLVPRVPEAEVAFGFAFEKFVLYAWSLGIGTVWIGGTMKREHFEKEAGLREGELMPCVTPLGYPAPKRSVRELVMRKGIGADSRLEAEKLFFDGAFDSPLAGEKKAAAENLIELVRWAPSAVNKQPWRVVAKDGLWHFFEKKDKGFVNDATGDLQKIDVGIALCHLFLGLEASGTRPELLLCDPGVDLPDGVEYVATVRA